MANMLSTYPDEKEQEVIKNTLDWLRTNGFFTALKNDNLCEWLDNHTDYYDRGIWFDSGSTKYIIGVDDLDWVIKVSIPSVVVYDKIDYAVYEAELYEEAVKEHIGEYFSPTYEFGKIEDLPITIQYRVAIDEKYFYNTFWEYCKDEFDRADFEDEDSYHNAISEDANCIDAENALYAVFEVIPDQLIDFVNKHHLNDFHERNFGLINDESVLIDFCGY